MINWWLRDVPLTIPGSEALEAQCMKPQAQLGTPSAWRVPSYEITFAAGSSGVMGSAIISGLYATEVSKLLS